MNQTLLGIDPGFSGAITALNFDLEKRFDAPTLIDVFDMPLKDENASALNSDEDARQVISGPRLVEWLHRLPNKPVMAFIERVASSPQMGVVSSFRFGQGEGLVCGVLDGMGISYRKIAPPVWKLHFGLSTNKKKSLEKIRELFPTKTHLFKLNRHDGRSESALIAHFGWQKFYRGTSNPEKELTFDDLK